MSDAVADDCVALLPPLLQSLEALSSVSRYLNPPDFKDVMEAVGAPDDALRAVQLRAELWPAALDGVRISLQTARDATLAAFEGLRATQDQGLDLWSAFRALRYVPRALEALYPLVPMLPLLSDFFIDPALRGDSKLRARVAGQANAESGVIHVDNDVGSRGGFSVYVPEYDADRPWPLIMALHGGHGHGRPFLWTWLRAARSCGAVLLTPTATGPTWALMGNDIDTPNLARILDHVRGRWNIDPARLLLTGMSDGGTFCYVSGLQTASPFTHLAPVSATFHPLLASTADADRMRGLPIYQVHGALDWMFPVEVARHARDALAAAGADVTYREIEDLSHCYPREVNTEILDWLARG